MPVIFQQPGPFSAEAAEGGGAAHQFSHDLPTLAAQQRTIAELYAQARHGGGSGGGIRPAPPPLQEFGPGAGQNMQAPQFRQERQADPLTQAETLRLQRLQQGLAAVDEQVGNDLLTEEEGNQFRLMLRTGIDPLRQRMEAAQAQALQQANQQAMHQHAQLVAMQGMSTEQLAARAEQFTHTITDDNGSYRVHFDPMTGRSTYHEVKPEGANRQEATQRQMAQLLQTERAALARERQTHLTAMTPEDRMPSHLRTPEAMEAAAMQRARAAAQFAGISLPTAGAGGGAGADTAPFTFDAPRTPAHRQVVDQFGAIRNNLRAADMPEDRRREIADSLNTAQGLIERHGNVANMSQEDRARYDRSLRESLSRIPERTTPQPAAITNRVRLRDSLEDELSRVGWNQNTVMFVHAYLPIMQRHGFNRAQAQSLFSRLRPIQRGASRSDIRSALDAIVPAE